MGEDEEATLSTLSSHRKLIDSLIEQHRGRFVNSAGDSVLAEFASVVNAVQCAVKIQSALKSENASLPPECRMEFRIGVNLADVMVDGEQIYGDGVNVAARLERSRRPRRHLHLGQGSRRGRQQTRTELRGHWRAGR
jgi:class 3 adenylate cyclase